MLVVLASNQDRVAAELVRYWGAERARLLTCRDLSRSGWRYQPGAAGRSVAVVDGRRVRASEIESVLVRLPYVFVEDLTHIVCADRSYVAQEMTAFLTAWLSELPCPVVNRPTAPCLGGPGWTDEQWLHAACGLGIRSARQASGHGLANRSLVPPSPLRKSVTVTIVGPRTFGDAPDSVVEAARRLACAAGTDLLDVHFDGTRAGLRFVAADPWPNVAQPAIADALIEWFQRR